ncbi:hypothetical protein SAMN05216548_1323 [Faunimonas pinastri]|uniref:Uncharacterized protein n=2 Tax=Faunimonas pinastri TaxID=1855383 RepID=A0A1H9QPT2_9HYPH|nr:hypothetical protein SAMN05216548_1323 [Faunimonas pinastri]
MGRKRGAEVEEPKMRGAALMDTLPLNRIAEADERAADALERIATLLEHREEEHHVEERAEELASTREMMRLLKEFAAGKGG